jgi:hypothetical protein
VTLGVIAGIAFSALYFLSTASFDPKVQATDAELVAFFSDSSNLRDNVISMYLVLASVPCFLLFLVTLRARLAAAEDADAPGSTFVFASGICFAATLLVASVARGLIAHSVKFGDEALPGPDTLRAVTLFATTMYALVTMPAAAITLAATGWLIVRTRGMAAWVGWSGLLTAGVTALLTPFLIATFALPLLFLWVTAASIELWRTREAPVAQPEPGVRMTRTGDVVTP